MPGTGTRIIDIRDWHAARARASARSNAPLVIVIVVLILAGLVGFAAPGGGTHPVIEPVQWDGSRP
jgi:hypothetical protein